MRFLVFLIIILIFTSCSDNKPTEINYCKDSPCKDSPIAHKTVCKVLDNDFTCECEDGYILNVGDGLCVLPEIDLCDDMECGENERCVEVADTHGEVSVRCECDDGYILDGGKCVINNEKKEIKIRIMAANLTSGQWQDYEGPGIRIMTAMNPDIILIQEFNYDMDFNNSTDDGEVNDLITEIFGADSGYQYYRGKEITLEDGDIPIPNGIISKYPILERGEWGDSRVDNRNFNYAKINIPGNKDLWVVSLHLKAGSSDDGVRSGETESLMQKIKFNIPDGDYIVIGGDLNTTDRNESCIDNLSQIFDISGPHPVCEDNKEGTNASRRNPYDWVIASKSISPFQVSSNFCYDEDIDHCKSYPNGLVFDSKKYDDYDLGVYFSPVELDDSRADSMQHMGVIKDFLIEYK